MVKSIPKKAFFWNVFVLCGAKSEIKNANCLIFKPLAFYLALPLGLEPRTL